MKKDWTETMRDKLSESAATPPDDLWTGISSELDAVTAPKKKNVRLIIWRWAAVAACLAALVICGVYLHLQNKAPNAHEAILAENNNPTPPIPKLDPLPVGQNIPATKGAIAQKSISQMSKATVDDRSQPNFANLNQAQADIAEKIADITVNTQVEDNVVFDVEDRYIPAECPDTSMVDDIDYEKLLLAQTQVSDSTEPPLTRRKNLSISLYACNTNMPNLASDNGDYASNNSEGTSGLPSSCDPPFSDDKPEKSARSAEGYNVKDARHKQPVRFGLTVRVPVSESLSIGTGVTYSMLSSTITWGNSSYTMYDTDQTLHYIGVPVSVDYNLTSYRAVSFYLTAGAMVEKCLYGQSRVSYSPSTDRVRENALQLSVFAGSGMQLNLNDHIALYAEPLATYYFDNHSSITNIYKDRPLNIDLRIGLRYTFK